MERNAVWSAAKPAEANGGKLDSWRAKLIDYKNVTVEVKRKTYNGKNLFLAVVREYPDCVGQGTTVEEAYNEVIGNYRAIYDYTKEKEQKLAILEKAFNNACKHIAEVEWFSMPQADPLDNSQKEIEYITKQNWNTIYFQAEKELKDEEI